MRKAVGVHRMNQQQGHASALELREQVGVVQQGDLTARATATFKAVHAGAEHQQVARIVAADACHVHRQRLALHTDGVGMQVRAQLCTAGISCGQKFGACAGVVSCEVGFELHAEFRIKRVISHRVRTKFRQPLRGDEFGALADGREVSNWCLLETSNKYLMIKKFYLLIQPCL